MGRDTRSGSVWIAWTCDIEKIWHTLILPSATRECSSLNSLVTLGPPLKKKKEKLSVYIKLVFPHKNIMLLESPSAVLAFKNIYNTAVA